MTEQQAATLLNRVKDISDGIWGYWSGPTWWPGMWELGSWLQMIQIAQLAALAVIVCLLAFQVARGR